MSETSVGTALYILKSTSYFSRMQKLIGSMAVVTASGLAQTLHKRLPPLIQAGPDAVAHQLKVNIE
jgi:hypothetical protein